MESEGKEYLQNKVNPYLIPLLKEVMGKRPENSYEFICNWIDTEGKKIQEQQTANAN